MQEKQQDPALNPEGLAVDEVKGLPSPRGHYRAAVLLSAYGNSPYLQEQVESIVRQLTPADILVIVDDGSRQVPWHHLQDLPSNYLLVTRLQTHGHAASFADLLLSDLVAADYYLFSDQDDIWLEGKLETQLATMQREQSLASVHGWIEFDTHQCQPQRAQQPLRQLSPAHYFFETPAPGMTLCLSDAARQQLRTRLDALAWTEHLSLLPHDRLICALISATDRITLIETPLVAYRQHGANQIGAESPSLFRRMARRAGGFPRVMKTLSSALGLYEAMLQHRAVSEAASQQPRARHPGLGRQTLRSRPSDNHLLKLALGMARGANRLRRSTPR